MPNLSPKQIEAFIAVMENGSVTAAARDLNISQPSVSRMLERFEYEVGFKAFIRGRGRMTPTPEAEIFFKEVAATYRGINYLNEVAKGIMKNNRGVIRIGVLPAFSNAWIAKHINQFLTGRPDIQLYISPMPSNTIIKAVLRHTLDIGISETASEREGIHSDRLFPRNDMVCILHSNDPLCSKSIIEPKDLSGDNFISFSSAVKIRPQIDNIFIDKGVERNIRIQVDQASSICHLVACGLGVSIVYSQIAKEYQHLGYEIREFRPHIRDSTYILTSTTRPLSRLVEEFRSILLEGINS